MSIWQFNAAITGYIKANSSSGDPKKFSSDEERDDIFDWLMATELFDNSLLTNHVYIWDGSVFNLERIVSFYNKE